MLRYLLFIMVIEKGNYVEVHYTGKLADGTVFDTSKGKKPLGFVVGGGQMIKGFDKAVEGMKKGDSKTFTLKPEDAYGGRREELKHSFPKDSAPEGVTEGAQVMLSAPNGQALPATVVKVTDEEVVVDLNHPLAGKELTFDITIEDVKDSAPAGSGSCGCGSSEGSCCSSGDDDSDGGCGCH